MILALLASLWVDTRAENRRRGVLHELERRLSTVERDEVEQPPPAFVSIVTIVREIVRKTSGMVPAIEQMGLLARLVGINRVWMERIGVVYAFRLVDESSVKLLFDRRAAIPVPSREARSLQLEETTVPLLLAHPESLTRTSADALYDKLRGAVEAENGWREALRIDPVSIRDWAERTGWRAVMRLPWSQIVAAATAWHAEMKKGLGYGKPIADDLVILRWPSGVTLQRLTTKRSFAAEGASMGHCVGGDQDEHHLPDGDSRYWRSTRDGNGGVYSLRSPSGVPAATFEVGYDVRPPGVDDEVWRPFARVLQIQGPEDDEIGSFDGVGLDGTTPFREDPVPYLLDALVRMRLDSTARDGGDYGVVSPDAEERLRNPKLLVPPPVRRPTWFPDLSADERSRLLQRRGYGMVTAPKRNPEGAWWALLSLLPLPTWSSLRTWKP